MLSISDNDDTTSPHQFSMLNLNTLNCLECYQTYIHILYHSLDRIQHKNIKFTMEQPYMLPILYCQYRDCRCPGDLSRQAISRHGINQTQAPHYTYLQLYTWLVTSWSLAVFTLYVNFPSSLIFIWRGKNIFTWIDAKELSCTQDAHRFAILLFPDIQ